MQVTVKLAICLLQDTVILSGVKAILCALLCSNKRRAHCPVLPLSCPDICPIRPCIAMTLNIMLQAACGLPGPHATPQRCTDTACDVLLRPIVDSLHN